MFRTSLELLHLAKYTQIKRHGVLIQDSVRFVWFMVFNATFHNISAILLRSVLLVEETGRPEKNHRSAVIH